MSFFLKSSEIFLALSPAGREALVEAAPKLQCCTASLPSLSTSSPFR
jgi:hypothetical protein